VEKGRSLRLAGRFDLAQSALESAQLEAKTLGDAAGGARALNELGRLRLLQSELDQALESYQEALAGCEAAGDRSCEAAAVLGLGRDQFSVALWAVVLPDGGFSVGMKMRHSQERNQPVSVSVALRVERLEPSGARKPAVLNQAGARKPVTRPEPR
jgi:tetratricopeptide (TPR) repeat protein